MLLLVSSLTVGCSGLGNNTAQDKACDPGNKRALALQAEAALNTAPVGFRRVKGGIHTSTYDGIETHICNDLLLFFTLEPAPDGLATLRALERHLRADGWTRLIVDARVQAIGATKNLFPGATATLNGSIIAGDQELSVRVSLPPAMRDPAP